MIRSGLAIAIAVSALTGVVLTAAPARAAAVAVFAASGETQVRPLLVAYSCVYWQSQDARDAASSVDAVRPVYEGVLSTVLRGVTKHLGECEKDPAQPARVVDLARGAMWNATYPKEQAQLVRLSVNPEVGRLSETQRSQYFALVGATDGSRLPPCSDSACSQSELSILAALYPDLYKNVTVLMGGADAFLSAAVSAFGGTPAKLVLADNTKLGRTCGKSQLLSYDGSKDPADRWSLQCAAPTGQVPAVIDIARPLTLIELPSACSAVTFEFNTVPGVQINPTAAVYYSVSAVVPSWSGSTICVPDKTGMTINYSLDVSPATLKRAQSAPEPTDVCLSLAHVRKLVQIAGTRTLAYQGSAVTLTSVKYAIVTQQPEWLSFELSGNVPLSSASCSKTVDHGHVVAYLCVAPAGGSLNMPQGTFSRSFTVTSPIGLCP